MELMVSVAILLGVLALIGTIFSTASKAGGNATAVTHVYRQLRQAAEMIRRDLENMDPASDALGIAGVAQQATDSRKTAAANLHRADVLMLLTDRGDARPYIASLGSSNPDDYLNNTMQVVYGHADTFEVTSSGTTTPKTIENASGVSAIPSYEWHLARRSVFFPITPLSGATTTLLLTDASFREGTTDLTTNTLEVYEATGYFPTGMFHTKAGSLYASGCNMVAAPDNFACYLYQVDPPDCSYALCSSWMLFKHTNSRWYLPPGTDWNRTEGATPNITDSESSVTLANLNTAVASVTHRVYRQFYDSAEPYYRRTVLDTTPATNAAQRMAAEFLPNCSEFRVEYTYDDPRDVDFQHWYYGDTSSPTTGDRLGGTNNLTRPIDWRVVPTGEQLIWSKITNSPTDRTNPFRWPRALRITLKCWDAGGRLDEPVTYTMVYTWPSGS
jgi:type II secretory pathway pseudopilin PulG